MAQVQHKPSKEEEVLNPTGGVGEGIPRAQQWQLQRPAGNCTPPQHETVAVHVGGNSAPGKDLNPMATVGKDL